MGVKSLGCFILLFVTKNQVTIVPDTRLLGIYKQFQHNSKWINFTLAGIFDLYIFE